LTVNYETTKNNTDSQNTCKATRIDTTSAPTIYSEKFNVKRVFEAYKTLSKFQNLKGKPCFDINDIIIGVIP